MEKRKPRRKQIFRKCRPSWSTSLGKQSPTKRINGSAKELSKKPRMKIRQPQSSTTSKRWHVTWNTVRVYTIWLHAMNVRVGWLRPRNGSVVLSKSIQISKWVMILSACCLWNWATSKMQKDLFWQGMISAIRLNGRSDLNNSLPRSI